MKTGIMKLLCLFVLAAQTSAFASARPAAVNEKLLKEFHKAFPQAEKVAWTENENSYVVVFMENTVRSKIEYDLEGRFLNATRYYQDGNLLPLHLSWQLHQRFADKTVFGVTETTSDSKTFYYVSLEGEKDWTTVKANADGVLKVTEKFEKQG